MGVPNEFDVTFVGAGVGALAAAALLARGGKRVRIIERTVAAGGKACVRREAGFVYDEGPSILVLRKVYEDLFSRLGLRMEEHLVLDDLATSFHVRGLDGRGFRIAREFEATLASVREGLGATAAQELRAFVTGLDAFARVIGLSYADRTFSHWLDFAHPRLVASGLFVSPFSKYEAYIDARVRDPLLREFLAGFPGYAGFHPAEAPASLALLPWSIFREGVFYPRGGVSAIPNALRRVAEDAGAVFRFGASVERFHCEEGAGGTRKVTSGSPSRVTRLHLEGGETLEIGTREQLVFGGCLGWLATVGAPELFPTTQRNAYAAQSPSFFTVQAALPRALREGWGLAHHNLFLPLRDAEGYKSYFEPGTAYPEMPPLYLNIPTVSDPSLAPQGFDNAFLVVSVASHLDAARAEAEATAYARQCEGWLAAHLPGFAFAPPPSPLAVKASPRFERELLQKGGQIYGPSLRTAQTLAGFARPHPRLPGTRNFWLVGGSTQPGAGLPMVIQSGKIVAEALLR
jgi:phytoene desaturase